MKKIQVNIIVATIIAAGFLVACTGDPEVLPEPKTGTLTGPRISLNLEPGPHYAKDAQVLWIKYTVWPQVAVWIEKLDGTYIDTIYVTEIIVTGKYDAAPKKGRPEALPVWSHLIKEGVDAVSSPTTVGATVRYGSGLAARLPAGEYIVKLEANRSYDWNTAFTKKNSGVNGQPSVIYAARLAVGGARTEATFLPIGTGSVDGSDGSVRPVLDGIDTALELFSDLKVSFEVL